MFGSCGRVSLATVLIAISWIHGCHGSPEEDRLVKQLFQSYMKYGRPGDNDEPLDVSHRLSLQQIVSYDVLTESVTVDVWEHYKWTDPRLVWDDADIGVKNIRFPTDMVWTPDVTPYNGWTSRRDETMVVIQNDGTCIWVPREYMTIPCTREGDSADCTLKMGSWTYSGLAVNLTNDGNKIDTTNLFDTGRFELEGQSVTRSVKNYDCCPEPYISIVYNITVGFKKPLPNAGNRVAGGLFGGWGLHLLHSLFLMFFSKSLVKVA